MALLVFAALAFASGAFAQTAQTEQSGQTEQSEQAEQSEASSGPLKEQALEAQAEGPVDRADGSETPEELAGDTESSDEDEWGDFEDWGENGKEASGGKAVAFQLGGFVEGLTGVRVVESSASANEFTAGEARFRLNLDATHEIASARFRGDVYADAVAGQIWFDIRDASIFVRGGNWFNMRVGRQVLTWGTGDFLFLNDLFPKDFNSFFIGRADEYLKAPANGFLVTFSIKKVGLDLVWKPIFEPDRYIDGERLSFFDPQAGQILGDRSPLTPIGPLLPDQRLRNGTFHGRLYGSVGAYELAAYGYAGYWLQPTAFDQTAMRPTYARLAVYGASVRGPLLGGLFNVEGALYDSFDDWWGTDPTIPNSQFRGLVGYEHELFPKFQMGFQYYLEYTFKYQQLIDNSLWPQYEPDEFRHLLTLRLTQLLVMDNLELSMFVFFSPNALDTYIRPRITYKIIEPLAVIVGANLMFGRDNYTFFGQLEENSNVYARVRYSF